MRYVAVVAAFVVTLWVVSMAAVFLVISVLGPHSPPASKPVEILTYGVCGAAVVVLPILVARRTWLHRGARSAARR